MAVSVEENDRPDNKQKFLVNTNTNILCNFCMRNNCSNVCFWNFIELLRTLKFHMPKKRCEML